MKTRVLTFYVSDRCGLTVDELFEQFERREGNASCVAGRLSVEYVIENPREAALAGLEIAAAGLGAHISELRDEPL